MPPPQSPVNAGALQLRLQVAGGTQTSWTGDPHRAGASLPTPLISFVSLDRILSLSLRLPICKKDVTRSMTAQHRKGQVRVYVLKGSLVCVTAGAYKFIIQEALVTPWLCDHN